MRVQGAQAYSINRVVDNNIIFAKDGSVCIVYHLKLPYKYALNEAKFDSRIQELFEAFSKTPNDCYLHKQDVYLKDSFDTSKVRDHLFLDEAFINYYQNCPTLGHSCILAFVLTNLKSLEKSYLKNPFKFDKHLSSEDKETLLIFSDGVKKAISIINNVYNTKAVEFNQEDLKYYLYRYVNGFVKTGYYDIDFRDKKIGDTHFDLYSFSRIEYFPDHIANIRKDNLSLENAPVYEGFMDMVGESFFANHIYNQIIYFQGDKIIQSEIDLRMGEYAKMRNISERINQKANQLKAFLEEVNTPLSETVLVKSHFNLILFDQDPEILKKDKAKFENILNSHSISFHKPEKEILKDIFLGSIIGREKKLHKDNFFVTHLKQALCLFSNTTLFKGDTKGVYFNERVLQTPVLLDTWDEDKKRISARNGIIVAGTGGGKSVTALNIITQYLSEGINVVVAEFGMSFKFITNLYPEISKHIRYNSSMPLGVNPFKLSQEGLTNAKLDLLNAIILKTWRIKSNFDDTHVSVSINKILKFYYSVINFDHSYESFYNFVVSFEKSDLERLDIDEKYFDLGSFRHICSEFISGGKYENVFKIDESTTEIIRNKQFVVFELTEIKKDPFLVTLILLILQETIDTNILADRSKKGALFFDEFAESSEMKDIYSGEEVLHSVATMYQKIRKENGSVWTIIQDPSQLPDNRYTKGIIANTQILMVLPSEEVTYKAIERSFELPEVATYLMKNIKSNKSLEKRPYTELFVKIGGEYLILRLELSKEAFLAFQTDGNLWDELAKDFEISGNFQKSISNIKYKYYEKNN